MRILIIIDLYPPDIVGGYELRCEETTNWLNNNGYNVEVLTTKSIGLNKDYPYKVDRLLEKYPLGKTPSSWSYLKKLFLAVKDNLIFRKVVAKFQPDLIYIWHCTGISRTLIPYIFNSKERKLIDVSSQWLWKVSTQHGPVYRVIEDNQQKNPNKLLTFFLRMLLPTFSRNTIKRIFKLNFQNAMGYFTSNWNKNFHSKYIDECKKFEVIYTGINLQEFPFCKKKFNNELIKLLYIGRISEDKGFILLLNQLAYIRSISKFDFEVSVVGNFNTDKEKNLIHRLIADLGLENVLSFNGQIKREELSAHYHQADFTVFPSICNEAFSRVPLESMSCGTPCISTDNPGSKELFDQDAPLIFLERSSEGLHKSLDPFLHDQALYEKISFEGREFVENAFTFDHFMKKVQENFLSSNGAE